MLQLSLHLMDMLFMSSLHIMTETDVLRRLFLVRDMMGIFLLGHNYLKCRN